MNHGRFYKKVIKLPQNKFFSIYVNAQPPTEKLKRQPQAAGVGLIHAYLLILHSLCGHNCLHLNVTTMGGITGESKRVVCSG